MFVQKDILKFGRDRCLCYVGLYLKWNLAIQLRAFVTFSRIVGNLEILLVLAVFRNESRIYNNGSLRHTFWYVGRGHATLKQAHAIESLYLTSVKFALTCDPLFSFVFSVVNLIRRHQTYESRQ